MGLRIVERELLVIAQQNKQPPMAMVQVVETIQDPMTHNEVVVEGEEDTLPLVRWVRQINTPQGEVPRVVQVELLQDLQTLPHWFLVEAVAVDVAQEEENRALVDLAELVPNK